MTQGFRSTPDGVVARLSSAERSLLRRLFEDVISLLAVQEPMEHSDARTRDPLEDLMNLSQEVHAPTDPAVHRLLPDASAEPQRAEEFRRYTERALREEKTAILRRCAMAVEHDPVHIERDAAGDFARALNDVRLVLATRLEITSAEDARRLERIAVEVNVDKPHSADEYMAVVYGFVSWLQDSLVEAMILDMGYE